MSENDPRKPLTQLHLYLAGLTSMECRGCQAGLKPAANGSGRGNGHSSSGHNSFQPLESYVQAVDEALPLGLQKVRLCGGEALLYPYWDALLDHLEKRALRVVIETTGPGLSAERAARISHLPHARVVFGWAGSLSEPQSAAPPDLAMEAVRQLSAAGVAPRIIVPVTRPTIRHIPEIIRAAEQAGAKSIRFTTPPQGYNAPGQVSEALSVEETIAIGRRVERELSKSTHLRLVFDHPPAFRGLQPQACVQGQGYCAILNQLSVLPDGSVALCSAAESIPELVFGKIGSDALEEIWSTHPMLVTLREGMPDRLEGICARCVMKTACLGYCVAENYLHSGSFFGPNEFCQAAEQVGLFPAGRIIENAWDW